jgi:hypothetical protein
MCDISELKLRVTCETPDSPIKLYIQLKKKGLIAICNDCWERIGNKNWECGKDPRPTLESLFSDRARFGENPIPTEYKAKEIKKDEEYNEENEEED